MLKDNQISIRSECFGYCKQCINGELYHELDTKLIRCTRCKFTSDPFKLYNAYEPDWSDKICTNCGKEAYTNDRVCWFCHDDKQKNVSPLYRQK